MSTDTVLAGQNTAFVEAVEFIWREAELLDQRAYAQWLTLWTPELRYVVPIDPSTTEFENVLNYAFDDRALLEKRVARLSEGQSVSARHAASTVRTISRFVVSQVDADVVHVRCAQLLAAYRREEIRLYAAELSYRLSRTSEGFRISEKIVRLANAGESLAAVGYLF